MSKPECRESRAVLFDPHGIVWAAAAMEGAVKGSQKEDGREEQQNDVDALGRLLPSPGGKPLPYQLQLPPGSMNGSVRVDRPPLARTSGNWEVVRAAFSKEVRALESKVAALERQLKVERSLIRCFCRSELARKNGCGN